MQSEHLSLALTRIPGTNSHVKNINDEHVGPKWCGRGVSVWVGVWRHIMCLKVGVGRPGACIQMNTQTGCARMRLGHCA